MIIMMIKHSVVSISRLPVSLKRDRMAYQKQEKERKQKTEIKEIEIRNVKMLIKIIFKVNYSNLQIFGEVCCKQRVFSFYGAPKAELES